MACLDDTRISDQQDPSASIIPHQIAQSINTARSKDDPRLKREFKMRELWGVHVILPVAGGAWLYA
jgi:hypothetical protein